MIMAISLATICFKIALPLFYLNSQTQYHQNKFDFSIEQCKDSALNSPSTYIPRDSEYRTVLKEGSLVVRIQSHTFARIDANFEIQDTNGNVKSKWSAILKNQDHEELETSEGPDGSTSAVMIFRCRKPYSVELRIPDDDRQWLCWLSAAIVHPMLARSGPGKRSLLLLRQK